MKTQREQFVTKILLLIFMSVNYILSAQLKQQQHYNISQLNNHVLNVHFSETPDKIFLLDYTIKINQDLNFLRNWKSWNEANKSLVNIDKDNIDFRSLFKESELSQVVERLEKNEIINLNSYQLKDNIELISEDEYLNNKGRKYRVSKPVAVKKGDQDIYSFLYCDFIDGIENGQGSIYIYKLIDGNWVLCFEYPLWVS